MSQPTYPTEPSFTPEGIGVPPPVREVPSTEPIMGPPTTPIGPNPAPPPPSPWPARLVSQPASPPQTTAPATNFSPTFVASTPGEGQSYPPNQPFPPSQSYPPSQPYPPGQYYPPSQLYGVGYQPPAMPPKKKKTWLIVLIIVLAVLLVGGGFFAYWYYAIRDDGIRGGRAEDDPVAAGEAKTAQAAVRGYLQALAAGNSNDALSFAVTRPLSYTFLTDTVLTASLSLNPITFQQAVREDLSSQEDIAVTADYQIGSQSVTTTYVTTLRDGYYFIESVTARVDLSGTYIPGIGMKLNGVSLGTGVVAPYLDLFPGSYQLTIDNSMLTLTGGQFVVSDPMASPSSIDMMVELAADTPGQLAAAAKTTLDGCMAEKSLSSSCGIGMPIIYSDGQIRDVDANSVQWAFITGSSDFPAEGFFYDPQSKPTEATATIDLKIRRTVNGAGSDANYYFYLCYDVTSVSVNFSDPANLDVSFYSLPDVSCPDPQL